MPTVLRLLPSLLLLAALAAPSHGQSTWDLAVGAGTGTTRFAWLEGSAARSLSHRLSLEGSGHLVSSMVTCEDVWPDSFSCGFGGWGADLGPSVRWFDPGWAEWRAVATAGVFRRTGDAFDHRTSVQWSAGVRVRVPMGHRLAAHVGVRRRWVHDRVHRELTGEGVGLTILSVGIGLGR